MSVTPPPPTPPSGSPPPAPPTFAPTPTQPTPVADPLRLCIFATVALLGWLAGPVALLWFASLGLVGYARARRAGLTRSACLLGDTRVVLGYLAVLVAAAIWGVVRLIRGA